jgi:transcription initiation factor IIE alpha subunit
MKKSEQLLQSKVVFKSNVTKSRKKSQEKINKQLNPKNSPATFERQFTGNFVCTTCGAAFTSENELVDHNILVHKPF